MDEDQGLEQDLVEVKYLEGAVNGQGLFDRGKRQWSVKETISLIEAYRVHPNLWNQEDPEYKNREKKYESLKEIAIIFATNLYEIERKIKNINCQYRRERRSYNISTRLATNKVFKPKWFGYAGMSFLHDRFRKTGSDYEDASMLRHSLDERNAENVPQVRSELAREQLRLMVRDHQSEPHRLIIREQQQCVEQREPHRLVIRDPQQSEQQMEQLQQSRFVCRDQPSEQMEQQSRFICREQPKEIPQVVSEEKRWRDEYEIFGELVAHKVRHLKTEASKATVQHLINNVLFCAQMGKYDYSQLSSFASGELSLCASPQIDIGFRESTSINDNM